MSDVLKKLIPGKKYLFHPSGMEQPYQLQGETVVYLFIGFDLEGCPVFVGGHGAFAKPKGDMHFLANLRQYREPRELTVWGVVWPRAAADGLTISTFVEEKTAREFAEDIKTAIDVFPITWKEKV